MILSHVACHKRLDLPYVADIMMYEAIWISKCSKVKYSQSLTCLFFQALIKDTCNSFLYDKKAKENKILNALH